MTANSNINPTAAGQSTGVVLAISQSKTSNTSACDTPSRDFERLAEVMEAVLVDNTCHINIPFIKRVEKSTALDFSQAISIIRAYPNAGSYVSFSERVGIPLGMLLQMKKRRPAHVMIAHRLNTKAKKLFDSIGRWHLGVDRIITLCSTQLGYAELFLPGRSIFIRAGSTDEQFYRPSDKTEEEDYILAVGSENRDYETLLAAVSGTGVKTKVVSSSPWCRKNAMINTLSSDDVEFLPRISYTALRELYHKAKMVVVPLHDVEYAAGLNGLLEAFCAHKAVVVSASRGLSDYVSHLHNSYSVPVGDTNAMACAIAALYSDASLRETLASGAKETVDNYANLQTFTAALQSEIIKAMKEDRAV